MRPHDTIVKLCNHHDYARAHGAKVQQNKAFACLLARALADRSGRLELEIHARKMEEFDLDNAKGAMVVVIDTATQRRIRAPLCRPLDVGHDVPQTWSRLVIASIAIEAREVVECPKGSGGPVQSMRPLSESELKKLEDDIRNAAGGNIPNLYETPANDIGRSRVA